jgi:Flp pilus assembly secretin CpaC
MYFITALALTAGGVSAQDGGDIFREVNDNTGSAESMQTPVPNSSRTESVDSVLRELKDYSYKGEAPEAENTLAEIPEEGLEEMPAAAGDIDVDALVETSRENYVAGEFGKAQAGFEQVIKIAPENILARMYLRKLLERDHRTVEVQGMKDVRQEWNTGLVLRTYELSGEACEKLQLTDVKKRVNVENRFPEVKFPKGTAAVYQPNVKKIFVRNTRENLQTLEEILEAMDVASLDTDVDQVEVEAKFVEVSEGTLEELGFQWNFDGSVRVGANGTDLQVDDGSGGVFSDALRGSPSGSSSLPFGTSAAGNGISSASAIGGASEWNTFRVEDTFNTTPSSMTMSYNGADPFEMIISALDQSTGTDVLSAPRVTVRSGEEATIRVGELHYYPDVYEGDSSQGSMLNVSYQDFEERLMGIDLTVTPEVDGDQIGLELHPRITELAGWQSWKLADANSIYNWRLVNERVYYQHGDVIAKLPIFKNREVETMVTIADGGTIGMGGLISDKVEAFCDKVPVLGSIPLLGRLFRNEGERSVKRNLLMFVTAKKVTPSGRIDTSRSFSSEEGGDSDESGDSSSDLFF